ncbi:hypothetical protein [Ahrensia marina]|uniref:Uncharacterized protein n=1 Tax=Ahrensia marina TaxID=1514904 RepID=A0A0N0E7W7_9HYPH|nr:hypothetical protein [Ahrensia marina]KPB01668.1 hypothetical protein SU32_07305 [Ahrensia marina]
MYDVNALSFLAAITSLRTLIERTSSCDSNAAISKPDQITACGTLERLFENFVVVGCQSAHVANQRLIQNLKEKELTYGQLLNATREIESRFADHLSEIKLLVLQPNEAQLMLPVDHLLRGTGSHVEGFPAAFPKASLEIEEAAKCLALNRYTAAVFHSMRALESGIKAFSLLLEIPDPTKPAEKNWGVMLRKITESLEEKWPKKHRLNGTLGAKYENIYATLDAVKNPWRNATMHVENTYSPHEALHITRCVAIFLVELAKYCDEEGRTGDAAPAMAEVADTNDDNTTKAE